MKKRNKIAIDLFTSKYRKRVVKPKKGKEVLKEKKIILLILAPITCIIFEDISVPFSKLSFTDFPLTYPSRKPPANKSPAPVKSTIFKSFFALHSVTILFSIAKALSLL